MKAIIEIDMDTVAFEHHPELELRLILLKLSQTIGDEAPNDCALFDSKGNRVGSYRVGHFPTTPTPHGFKG